MYFINLVLMVTLGAAWCVACQLWWFKSTLCGKVCWLLFPKKWLGDRHKELHDMDMFDLVEVLPASDTPTKLMQLVTCRYCMTTYFAMAYAALAYAAFPLEFIPAVIVWVASAGAGLILYSHDSN